MKACVFVLLTLAIGCADVKSVTRLEYGNNIAFLKGKDAAVRNLSLVSGPRIPVGNCNLDLMCGPELFERTSSWTEVEQSIDINPRVMYFFSPVTFLHLELDYSVIHSNGTQNAFIMAAWEKEW